MQTLRASCSKAGPKNFAPPQTPSRHTNTRRLTACDSCVHEQPVCTLVSPILFDAQTRAIRFSTVHGEAGQWLKWFCEAGGGSPDEARLEQTPYPFQPH